MYRTLFELGPLSVHTYGVMLAIAFWLGIELSARAARKHDIDETRIIDLGIVILISSVIGSRLLYVLFHLDDYSSPLQFFALWEGGATFYGGLILAAGNAIMPETPLENIRAYLETRTSV